MRNLLSATVAMLFGYCGVACADLHYQGQFIIINASGGCDTFITNGLTANADYHPAFVDDAPPQKFKTSAMNVYYNILGLYGAHVMRIENRNFPHSPEGKFEKPNPFTETNVDWFDYKPAYPANLVVISERLEKNAGRICVFDHAGQGRQYRGQRYRGDLRYYVRIYRRPEQPVSLTTASSRLRDHRAARRAAWPAAARR